MPLAIMLFFLILCLALVVILRTVLSPPKRTHSHRIYSNKILVNLDECEFIGTDYIKESVDRNIFNASAASFVLDPNLYSHDTHLNDVTATYVKYVHKGEKYFSGPITKDKITLQALFMEKKFTYIYYDNKPSNDYFFDLNFLDPS